MTRSLTARNVLLIVLAILPITACVSYFNDVVPVPPSAQTAHLSDAQIHEAVKAIGAELAKIGMKESSRLSDFQEMDRSTQYPVTSTFTVGMFVFADPEVPGEITVYCSVGKRSGDFSVRIVQLSWPFEDDIVNSVRSSVRRALEAQFPGWQVTEAPHRELRLLGP